MSRLHGDTEGQTALLSFVIIKLVSVCLLLAAMSALTMLFRKGLKSNV